MTQAKIVQQRDDLLFQPDRRGRRAAASLAGQAAVSIERLKLTLQDALRVLALPIGVGVKLWTALLTSQACYITRSARGNGTACAYPTAIPHADFALWTCALFGAAAVAVVLLIAKYDALTPPAIEAAPSARSRSRGGSGSATGVSEPLITI